MIFFLILIKSITCKQRSPGRLEKILKALIISGTNQYGPCCNRRHTTKRMWLNLGDYKFQCVYIVIKKSKW